ncbi:MAG: bifunctional UDP-sugar hydrolase/5'-nucleotidase [Candidatus Treponema excrementipullorum]|uniref:Bifunctional metallophosphatase/5'-nucleotidase n=1 Tax=Candidatus Treponema excrementipullorum TaxID=2838768 RepID=A0A9E2KZZ9_9SPIR|nr:bifunctional metallophosphatase/5'-nucleotidase [Candidatus Treponema excrementipullorum]MDY2755409.1 bifunctional UDP-sugar hydrolase/5'-nucleotidase [Candidatus Treponema excrementipullorum]MDY4465140.1 bifunctional UDP-sugar hydrolase/5'-nucleotidase [Candidatus Treponema excrementipullorum]
MTKLKRFLLVSVAILSAVLISCTSVGEPRVYPEGPVSFTIVETTDIHGMIFPYDFLTEQESPVSMAQISTYVKGLRDAGKSVLLLDDGDSLQGQPTVYYYNFVETEQEHLWASVLNYMGYDAVTMGNHDVETGKAVYSRLEKQVNMPLICANLVSEKNGKPYFDPYTIIEKDGVRIAVLGLLEPGIERQLPKVLYEGLKTEDMVESAAKWIPVIQKKENPDLIIGLFHAGADHTYDPAEYKNENASQLVAEQVEGFDLILVGHDHQGWSGLGYDAESRTKTKEVVSPSGKVVPIYGATNGARTVVSIDVTMEYDAATGTWTKDFDGELVDVSAYEADQAFLDTFATAREDVSVWVGRSIGELATTLTSDEAMFGDSYFLSFIHQLQMEIAETELKQKIDISMAAPLSSTAVLNAGTIKVKDMFSLYPFENFFYIMNLTGQQVKDAMEYSYGGWFNQMTSENDHLISFKTDAAGNLIYNDRYNSYDTTARSYNYDSYAGLIYTVDVTKPAGERVTIVSMADGTPFDLTKTYKVGVNSYRASGGGSHLIDGAGIDPEVLQNMELVETSTVKDLRLYMMQWFENTTGPVTVEKLDNWKVIPENYLEKGREKDYPLLYPQN